MKPSLKKSKGGWHSFKLKMLLVLSVVGPGIIAGTADNDAGGIATYSVAGAHFGYQMLWILLLITFVLALTQEMGARLGLVTGKGLAALIRENFSLRLTTFVVAVTFLANWANILAEYAGISTVADIYGVPRWLAVILAGIAIWAIVYRGKFITVQRIFLTSSILFLAYILAGFLAHPDWMQAFRSTAVPSLTWSHDFFFTAVALIGTTITAWGQFFVQSYFVDKAVSAQHLKIARWDVFVGAFWTNIVAFFIVVATAATLYKAGIRIEDAGQAAIALQPFAGDLAKHLFAWGLVNASLLGLAIISMTSAYVVTEAFGFEGRVDLKAESPTFYRIFGFCIFSAALVSLIPNLPLVSILVGSQLLNTFVLPLIFTVILLLLNNTNLMGRYKNSLSLNLISSFSVFFLIAMSLTLIWMTIGKILL